MRNRNVKTNLIKNHFFLEKTGKRVYTGRNICSKQAQGLAVRI